MGQVYIRNKDIAVAEIPLNDFYREGFAYENRNDSPPSVLELSSLRK